MYLYIMISIAKEEAWTAFNTSLFFKPQTLDFFINEKINNIFSF